METLPSISYTAVALVVFGRQLCLPLPADLLLMAAGALAARGRLSAALILCVSVIGCVCADFVWYEAGRNWGGKILHFLCTLSSNPRKCVNRAHEAFGRFGIWSLLFAKFVPGLDAVTPPLAGMEGCNRPTFVLLDGVGSFCWSGAYVVVGYFFAHQIGEVLHLLRASAHIFVLTVGVPLSIYATLRASQLIRMVQRLRLKTMSPHLLDQKLKEHEKVAVIDLLEFEESTAAVEGIPGAVRIDPDRLRRRNRVLFPEDLQVVLYSSSLHEVISARVAVALRRRGIKNVWVLDGGLNGWKAAGFPTTMNLNSPEESNARPGIRVLRRADGLYERLRSRWRSRTSSQSTRRL